MTALLPAIALVHDYLIQMGGAERVVAVMRRAFPQAPLYTSATDHSRLLSDFDGCDIHNSFMQRLPGMNTHFKRYFPLYPLAFRMLKSPQVAATWISASSFAKFIRTPKGTVTFCYCHAPTRFLWDTNNYVDSEVRNRILNYISRLLIVPLRAWDCTAARRMHYIIANSENVKRRIQRVYGRDAVVIHPPVDVTGLSVCTDHQGYDIVVSRLVAYKRIDLAVRAYARAGRELRIVGEGTDRARLEKLGAKCVNFLGRVGESELRRQLAGARMLVFPGEEDFGISPVEAQACGKPVIAYAAGGALETVVPGQTGFFFHEQTPESLLASVEKAERMTWIPTLIRKNAERFSEEMFLRRMIGYMESKLGYPLEGIATL